MLEDTDTATAATAEEQATPHDAPNQEITAKEEVQAAPEATGEEAPKGEGEEAAQATLTDEQVEKLLTEDSRFRERVMASDDVQSGLDEAIDSILNEKEETARVVQAKQVEQQTLAEAVKAHNEGDSKALGDYALSYFRSQRANELASEAAEATTSARMNDMLRTEYGPELEALAKTKEASRLDRIQDAPTFYRETLKALNQMRSSAGDATTKDQVDEMSRAAANTATAAKARGDAAGSGNLPGGTATEGAEGQDIDSLIHDGFKDLYN